MLPVTTTEQRQTSQSIRLFFWRYRFRVKEFANGSTTSIQTVCAQFGDDALQADVPRRVRRLSSPTHCPSNPRSRRSGSPIQDCHPQTYSILFSEKKGKTQQQIYVTRRFGWNFSNEM
ncbi:hypothetical protein PHSY_000226 [Pseudozyma hubeiensis SY62]|uniref:Uncharacterized protein n=1 Tax=Pseudozyma hubeiensis (strain SY62) TaxID=1305764 RepID=R9NW37_PSEHS|nr:hypothetical protein PHSY_000226 [Pseudozyma hubeiensis SY62]GAC92671.1 hypothetical protein PHSY_000226 [Pseudozyma hubeiensis SY62]